MQAAVLTHQVPFTTGIQMVHQRMVIVVYHNGNIVNVALCHTGENKVNQTVTAGKRNRSHHTHIYQFRNQRVIAVGENNAKGTSI